MNADRDDDRPLTDADRTSETRFGPRPVPKGHHVPRGLPDSRRVIPSGRVSPDGRSAYPTPALGTKIAVWGGIALGVAGGTAAAVLAIRKIAEGLSDEPHGPHDRDQPRPASAPRFAQMDDDEREAIRSRVRAQDRADRREAARMRAEASQRRATPRRRKGNFAQDVIDTSTKLSESLEGLAKSMGIAIEGFRSVAGQATGIVQQFAATADQLRSALRGDHPPAPRRSDEEDRTHRL